MYVLCVQQEAGVRSLPGLDITLTIDDAIPILYQGSESEILGIIKIYMWQLNIALYLSQNNPTHS